MVQLTDDDRDLLAQGAVAEGVSRSELVRRALRAYLAGQANTAISRTIREGYTRMPESDTEVSEATAGARRLLSDPDLPW